MIIKTPDLVGLTNNKFLTVIPVAEISDSHVTQKLVETLAAGGWTQLSVTIGPLGLNDYEFISAQSPWYDTANIPSWYSGGRVYLHITHYDLTASFFPDDKGFDIVVGEYYEGAAVNLSTQGFRCNYVNVGYDLYIFANPHELRMWGGEPSLLTLGSAGQKLDREFYCSALGVPRPVLQGQKVITSLIAQGWTWGPFAQNTRQYAYYCFRTVIGVYSASRLTFATGTFPPSSNVVPSRGVWIPSLDSNMTTGVQRPFLIPAFVRYRPVELTAAGSLAYSYGFLWDCCHVYNPSVFSSVSVHTCSLPPKGTVMIINEKPFMRIPDAFSFSFGVNSQPLWLSLPVGE